MSSRDILAGPPSLPRVEARLPNDSTRQLEAGKEDRRRRRRRRRAQKTMEAEALGAGVPRGPGSEDSVSGYLTLKGSSSSKRFSEKRTFETKIFNISVCLPACTLHCLSCQLSDDLSHFVCLRLSISSFVAKQGKALMGERSKLVAKSLHDGRPHGHDHDHNHSRDIPSLDPHAVRASWRSGVVMSAAPVQKSMTMSGRAQNTTSSFQLSSFSHTITPSHSASASSRSSSQSDSEESSRIGRSSRSGSSRSSRSRSGRSSRSGSGRSSRCGSL